MSVDIPSITHPGKPFDVHIAVLDENGYPSLQCEGSARVKLIDEDVFDIPFSFEIPAVASLKDVQLPREGLFRLSATFGELHVYSNPTLCTSENPPDIYWGDPHVHTILSNCFPDKCRSLNFCFASARYLSALDWVSAADHVSNGRCDFSKWKEQRTVADLYNDPPGFVTLPAYEASLKGGAGGDNNVYMLRFPEMYVDDYDEGNVKTLCEKLNGALSAEEFFVVPHHTTRTGKHGEIPDDIYPGPQAMPVIEIHSKWGTSEYRGNSNPLQKIHGGPSYAADLLSRGLKLGFIAGTDTHNTMPSGSGQEPGHIDRLPGLTAVRCSSLSRQSVFDAIRHRQCYAASYERILMHGLIVGHEFGEELQYSALSNPPGIDLLVAAKSNITRVDIVRNGKTVYTTTPHSWNAHVAFEDKEDFGKISMTSRFFGDFVYYYVRVTCESGAQAWSSPVWVLD